MPRCLAASCHATGMLLNVNSGCLSFLYFYFNSDQEKTVFITDSMKIYERDEPRRTIYFDKVIEVTVLLEEIDRALALKLKIKQAVTDAYIKEILNPQIKQINEAQEKWRTLLLEIPCHLFPQAPEDIRIE